MPLATPSTLALSTMTLPIAEPAMPVAAPDALELSATVPTTFELFPKFPPEMRQRVWGYTIIPRVVNLIYDPEKDKFYSLNSTVPAILHVCRESRMVGLKVTTLKPSFGTASHPPKIWFDFAQDTLFFDDWMSACSLKFGLFPTDPDSPPYPEGSMDGDTMEAVERVAVNYDPDDYLQVRRNARNILTSFPNLKTLFVVLEGIDAQSRYNYPVPSAKRSAIEFVDIPTTTVCEHESLQLVYWKLDQKELKVVKGSHGMLRFSNNKAYITSNTGCRVKACNCQKYKLEPRKCHICLQKESIEIVLALPSDDTDVMPNIKLVAAFREDSLKSDFGCIISDTPDSEITSEYDLSDSESGSVLYSYGNNMFTPESDWEAEIIEEEIEQEAMRVEAYLASDTTDNSKDFETWDVELRREVVELNDDDNNFIEVMGYDFSSIEDRCIWVGYDYLGMRAEL